MSPIIKAAGLATLILFFILLIIIGIVYPPLSLVVVGILAITAIFALWYSMFSVFYDEFRKNPSSRRYW